MTKEDRRRRYRDISVPLSVQERDDMRRERAKKRHREYQRGHYCTVCCRVPREVGEAFKRLCYSYRTTPNSVLKRAVLDAVLAEERH